MLRRDIEGLRIFANGGRRILDFRYLLPGQANADLLEGSGDPLQFPDVLLEILALRGECLGECDGAVLEIRAVGELSPSWIDVRRLVVEPGECCVFGSRW